MDHFPDLKPRPRNIGDMLRKAREASNWSVEDAASRCGYTRQQWSNFERGRSLPSLERVDRICDELRMNPSPVLRQWVCDKLKDRPSRIRRMLETSAQPHTSQNVPWNGTDPATDVLKGIADFPMDNVTAGLVYSIAESICLYRKNLTHDSRKRHFRVKSIAEGVEGVSWSDIEGMEHLKQLPVGWSRDGIGFLATFIQIAPRCGGFHQHLEDRFLDAGIEFFSVVSGAGHAFFESPREDKKVWKHRELGVGTAGFYRGNRGHCYVSTGNEPLVVFLVCVPFPPTIEAHQRQGREPTGQSDGFEFSLEQLERSQLPESLRKKIKEELGLKKGGRGGRR